ncbi:NAD-dependent epimerase/dehydratase family protein [Microbacterium sp. A1-JK]|uniref:NAD-dependent epimerase/dehydratase family protein n=1 Tax=Microbacterium sp. A1-JK TaxID=3177516 RepID=UPI003889B825
MRALITGVAGFIGSSLARELLDRGDQVVGIDSLTDYYSKDLKRDNLARLDSNRFTFIESDVRDLDLPELLSTIDVIYHQAGQPGVRMSWGSDFGIYTELNVNTTQVLLEAASRSQTVKRFVYASSSSIYGDAPDFPTGESELPRPLSPYGVTKLAAEHLCVLYAKNFGLSTVSLRYFTVYGPRQRPDMAFTRFLRAAEAGEAIELYGDGSQIRDFTFISDIVRANILAAQGDIPPGSVFNVAGGSSVSVNEVIDIISSLTGTTVKVNRSARALGDVKRTGGSTDAFATATGWTPTHSIEDGLQRQLEWVRHS